MSDRQIKLEEFAGELGLWPDLAFVIEKTGRDLTLLTQVAALPIYASHATTRLGSYVSRDGRPVCIRLQMKQEPGLLRETLLHEVAHACDHIDNQPGQTYRQAHGPGWQRWMTAFGLEPRATGRSEVLKQLYRQRMKVVAICGGCGAEIIRVRRLNRRRRYHHAACGGLLKPL